MPTQSDLGVWHHYAIFENLEEGGQLKTKNVPSTQTQREVITNRGKNSKFKADVRLVTCVHGTMSEHDPTFASLVVLEYHLVCTGKKHRYNSLTTRLAFESQDPQDPKTEPFVRAYAPFKLSNTMDPIEVEHKEKLNAEASVGVDFTPANAGAKIDSGYEKKYKQNDFASGQAFQEFTDGKLGSDAVLWELRENETKKVGVPDTFRLAVLIQRANTEKFIGTMSLDLHAGIWFAATNSFKKACGVLDGDDPIIFDPSLSPQGETVEVAPTCLGVYTDRSKLSGLTPVHLL